MVITLWKSKKARTVTETEVSLGSQGEGEEKFESIFISRTIVRMVIALFDFLKVLIPAPIQKVIAKRLDNSKSKSEIDADNRPAFDLLRASVNLMVASAVISYATSHKLPLSTTYVTFMVAMGTSFADLAWGRESAVYRVTGVLTVIGGWFMTAMLAFTVSGIMAAVIFFTEFYGILGLLLVVALIIWRNHRKHSERARATDLDRVFNLKKVTDVKGTISVTFEQMGLLLKEIRESLKNTFNALYEQNNYVLRIERKRINQLQRWANIITANIFKTIRLMEKEHLAVSHEYGQTVRRLQKLVDGTRDIVLRSYFHVSNQHKGLLDNQINDLKVVQEILLAVIADLETAINKRDMRCYDAVVEKNKKLRAIAKNHNQVQIERIRKGESKTRLSILFYAIVGNAMMLSKQNLRLLEIFSATLSDAGKYVQEFDMD
jgi:Na+/phosphate symporter